MDSGFSQIIFGSATKGRAKKEKSRLLEHAIIYEMKTHTATICFLLKSI